MALASNMGAELPGAWVYHDSYHSAGIFAEFQGCYLVTVPKKFKGEFLSFLQERGPHSMELGYVEGNSISIPTDAVYPAVNVNLSDLREASDSFFRDWMEG
jgi:phosphoribosylformylglycinamidine synthase